MKSNKGFLMSQEALISLIILFLMLFSLLPPQETGMEKVVLYRQGSDLLQIIIKKDMVEKRRVGKIKTLSRALDPEMKIALRLEEKVLIDQSPKEKKVQVKRHIFREGELKTVTLSVGF